MNTGINWESHIQSQIKHTDEMLNYKAEIVTSCQEKSADDCDRATNENTAHTAHTEIKNLAIRKRQLIAALQRLKNDDFGFCLECGVDIPERRLEIEPACKYCIDCQASLELTSQHYVS